jgi:hypothetical protein
LEVNRDDFATLCNIVLWKLIVDSNFGLRNLVSSVFEQCEGVIFMVIVFRLHLSASFCLVALMSSFVFPFQVQRTLSDTLITCIVGLKWWSCFDSVFFVVEYAGSVPLLEEKKPEEITDDTMEEVEDKGPGGTPSLTESKSSKRRKAKKEKSFKEGRDVDIPPTPESESGAKEEDSNGEEHGEGSTVDPKEILKRMTSLKKKKSMKEGDSAAKAAAAEVSARAARLAAAKKKEKNHYNQQPVR